MAYENLLRSVEESAEERERDLRKKAELQVEEIRARAKKEAEEIEERSIREAERSAITERNKMLYLAKGQIKVEELTQKEAIFRQVLAQAAENLALLRNNSRYPDVFEHLCREAAGAMGDLPFLVHVDRRDLELCTRTVNRLNIRCEIVPDLNSAGGLVISSPDGLVTLDNTLESRLKRAEDLKKLEIYAVLFGG